MVKLDSQDCHQTSPLKTGETFRSVRTLWSWHPSLPIVELLTHFRLCTWNALLLPFPSPLLVSIWLSTDYGENTSHKQGATRQHPSAHVLCFRIMKISTQETKHLWGNWNPFTGNRAISDCRNWYCCNLEPKWHPQVACGLSHGKGLVPREVPLGSGGPYSRVSPGKGWCDSHLSPFSFTSWPRVERLCSSTHSPCGVLPPG